MQGGGETIGGAVTDLDGVFFGFEFGDGANGAEDFFLHDLHVFTDIGKDGGFDKVTFIAFPFATAFDFGPFLFTGVNVSVER